MRMVLKYVVQVVPFSLTNTQYKDVKNGSFDNICDAEKYIEKLSFDDITKVGREHNFYRIDKRYRLEVTQ